MQIDINKMVERFTDFATFVPKYEWLFNRPEKIRTSFRGILSALEGLNSSEADDLLDFVKKVLEVAAKESEITVMKPKDEEAAAPPSVIDEPQGTEQK